MTICNCSTPLSLARDIFEAALTSSNYLDVHGWQFTPTSFAYLIKTLRGQGYIKSGVQSLQTTVPTDPQMHEFYVVLSKTAPICTVSDIDLLTKASAELRDIEISRDDEAVRLAPLNETIGHLRSEIARVEADNAAIVARLQADNAVASRAFKRTMRRQSRVFRRKMRQYWHPRRGE